MTATTQTADNAATRATDDARDAVAEARSGLADTIDAVRSTAGSVGDRLPAVMDSVRSGASDGARTLRAWPEPTQRLVAAFSLGLGLGLTIAGAPRLISAAALLPAIVIAGATAGRDPARGSH